MCNQNAIHSRREQASEVNSVRCKGQAFSFPFESEAMGMAGDVVTADHDYDRQRHLKVAAIGFQRRPKQEGYCRVK